MDKVVDMGKYQRGEVKKEISKPVYNPQQIRERGEAAEVLVGTDGWKYLHDWMKLQTEEFTKVLINVQQNDINRINDIRMYIHAFKGIMDKPQEWIDEKNKLEGGK
jgi:uncharacterized protein YciU (UPF0263 family)